MAVVALERITKRYPGVAAPAVDEVSLTIADGEFMVLLGPSGCGKSTTLRMIAGLESITEGTLSIDGAVMNRVPAKDRDIAMVFQSYALYPHMNVRDNLSFGLKRRGIERAEVAGRVKAVSETLGLAGLLDRKPFALSGGQRQRVALGRAIVRDPKVFLFDEPLSNLDAALRSHTRAELIKQYHRLGATMIYVTHDQVEAMTMGSRICVMHQGRVVQVGAPLEVYRNPADTFVASFIGSPPTNLLDAEIVAEGGATLLRVLGQLVPLRRHRPEALAVLAGDRLIFGVRPEDLYLVPPPGKAERSIAIRAQVVAVEPLGAETLLLLSAGPKGSELTARVGRDVALAPGARIDLHLDLEACHLFDPASGKALAPATRP